LNFDIFSPAPGDIDVTSHFEQESSRETKIAPRLVPIATKASVMLDGNLHDDLQGLMATPL
jgi:hypothetical protein